MDEREINLFFLAVFLQKRPLRHSWSGSGYEKRAPSPIRFLSEKRMETSRAREILCYWNLRMGVGGGGLGGHAAQCFGGNSAVPPASASQPLSYTNTQWCTLSFSSHSRGRGTRGPPGLPPRPAIFITNLYSPPRAAGTPGVVECQGLFVLF